MNTLTRSKKSISDDSIDASAASAIIDKKKTISEEIMEALLDPRVIHAQSKILSPLIAQEVSRVIDNKLESLSSSINSVAEENKKLQTVTDQLVISNNTLSAENTQLRSQIDSLSVYTRRDDLVFYGLRYSSFADV